MQNISPEILNKNQNLTEQLDDPCHIYVHILHVQTARSLFVKIPSFQMFEINVTALSDEQTKTKLEIEIQKRLPNKQQIVIHYQ